jgi:uncharacterized protein
MNSSVSLKENSNKNLNSEIVKSIIKMISISISIIFIIVSAFITLKKIEISDNPDLCEGDNTKNIGLEITPIEINTTNETLNYFLEVADTSKERELGLMCRNYLPVNSGMLFVFDSEEKQSFWMKNTLIPLDILFLNDEKKIVSIYQNAEPMRVDLLYRSIIPVKYVIELNGGQVKTNNITKESTVEF